jgi:hypothetical protein
MTAAVRVINAMQFTGSNAAAVVAFIGTLRDSSFAGNFQSPSPSVAGGVLTLHFADDGGGPTPYDLLINTGDWIISPASPGTLGEVVSANDVVPLSSLTT